MIRIEIGEAHLDLGLDPTGHYPTDDLLNAVVRTLRAVGTEESADVIDRLAGLAEVPEVGTARVHLGQLEGHDGPDYVILDDDDLRRAALAKLAGWQRMVTPAELDAEAGPPVYGRGDTLEVVDDEGTGHPYRINGIEPASSLSDVVDGALVLVLAPVE